MIMFILANLASIVVFAVIVAVVFGCIYILKKDGGKGGCSSCGGECGSCPSASLCHNDDKPDIFDGR